MSPSTGRKAERDHLHQRLPAGSWLRTLLPASHARYMVTQLLPKAACVPTPDCCHGNVSVRQANGCFQARVRSRSLKRHPTGCLS